MIPEEEDPKVIKAILGDVRQADVERLALAHKSLTPLMKEAWVLRDDLAAALQISGLLHEDAELLDLGSDLNAFVSRIETEVGGFIARFRKRTWG